MRESISTFVEKILTIVLLRSFRARLIFLSACVAVWFVFGTMMILRGSVEKERLKTISGNLKHYAIVNIPAGSRRRIDVLALTIANLQDKIALYLSTRDDYLPILEKFKVERQIKILYNDKGGVGADGYNLHIYQIDYGNETVIAYEHTTKVDRSVGIILYLVGLAFTFPIIFTVRQERRRSKRNHNLRSGALTPLKRKESRENNPPAVK